MYKDSVHFCLLLWLQLTRHSPFIWLISISCISPALNSIRPLFHGCFSTSQYQYPHIRIRWKMKYVEETASDKMAQWQTTYRQLLGISGVKKKVTERISPPLPNCFTCPFKNDLHYLSCYFAFHGKILLVSLNYIKSIGGI